MQYPWTAFCMPQLNGMSQPLCGKCLHLTNLGTKATLIVRIVDMCGHGGESSGHSLGPAAANACVKEVINDSKGGSACT